MPGDTDGSSRADAARRTWLVPAATFLAGCAVGAVVVGAGLGGDDEPDRPAAVGQTGQGSADSGADGGADAPPAGGDPGLYVRVPDACVRTADGATALVEQVDRIVAAVAGLEPEPLRSSVDDVQQVRDSVSELAEQCRAEAARRLEGADAGAAPQTSAAP